MAEVNAYRVVLYGSSEDKPNLKAKVELYSRSGGETASSVGKIRFWNEELPKDEQNKGKPTMNLPATLLGDVIEVLRRESPIYYAFHEGRVVLGTAVEPVGKLDPGGKADSTR